MRAFLFFTLLGGLMAQAQNPAASEPRKAAITGTIRDRTTGQPLRDYIVSTYVNATWLNNAVSMNAATKDVQSKTDENGNYRLGDLPHGRYKVQAKSSKGFAGVLSKIILVSGEDAKLDFQMLVPGTVSGKVLDENDEPVPGIFLFAVSKDYFLGGIGYHLLATAGTNDRGEYRFDRLDAGRPYRIVAERRPRQIPPWSEVPLNPRMRKLAPMRTWYPNSPDREGAAPITLRPGEDRTNVNIVMKKSPSYCAEGIVSAPPAQGNITFFYEAQQPSSGAHPGGGMYVVAPSGTLGPDRKFRFCDLTRGDYRISLMQRGTAPFQGVASYAVLPVTVTDRDLAGLEIGMSTGITAQGEVAFEGPPPPEPVTAKVVVSLTPLLRSSMGENSGGRYEIPSTFSLKDLPIDDYFVRPSLNAPRLYIKDITYAGRTILNRPFRLGSAIGDAGIRVLIGQDGGNVNIQISNKDGSPAPDMHVVLMPAEVTSEADLADRFVYTEADQSGAYTSATLAPGKYLVAATDEYFDSTEESIRRLWQSKLRFTEVTLPPGGNVQVKLEPFR